MKTSLKKDEKKKRITRSKLKRIQCEFRKRRCRNTWVPKHVVTVIDEEAEDEIDVVHLKTRGSGC